MKYGAFKGATRYELYIGWFYITIPYWAYLKLGIWPKIGIDKL